MTYEAILGPLSRVVCCIVPFAWLPALAILYVTRRGKEKSPPKRDR